MLTYSPYRIYERLTRYRLDYNNIPVLSISLFLEKKIEMNVNSMKRSILRKYVFTPYRDSFKVEGLNTMSRSEFRKDLSKVIFKEIRRTFLHTNLKLKLVDIKNHEFIEHILNQIESNLIVNEIMYG